MIQGLTAKSEARITITVWDIPEMNQLGGGGRGGGGIKEGEREQFWITDLQSNGSILKVE